AIYMNTDSGSESVQNCTFLNNQAQGTGANAGTGGAIRVRNGNGTTNINLNRFLGNTQAAAGGGGGVYKNANPGGAVATNNWWGCDGFPGTAGCDSSFPTTSTPSPGANQIQFDPR